MHFIISINNGHRWNETQDSITSTTGQNIRDGWCYLVADGVLPDTASWIVVEADGSGLTSLDSVEISPPDVVVSVEPGEISPGDTASIVLKRRDLDGTLVDYSPWQSFEIGFVSGEEYGTILSSGDTAHYFSNASQPFEFIASDSIDADSVTVGIRVGPVPALPTAAHRGDQNKAGQTERAVKGHSRTNVPTAAMKNSSTKQSASAKGGKLARSTDDFMYNDDYGVGYVTIKKKETGCPVVRLSSDTVMTEDTITVTVAKKLEDGTIVPYPAETQFNLSLIKGAGYGTLVGSGGRGTTITSTNPAMFIANDSIDVGAASVTIHADINSGEAVALKKGNVKKAASEVCVPTEASLVVEKTEIAVNIPPLWQAWPTLPEGLSGGNPGDRNTKDFTVVVTRGGKPAAKYGVTVQAILVLPSGGHSHLNQPPADKMGILKDLSTGKEGKGVLVTATGGDGEIHIRYTAPEFSGTIQLIATSLTEHASGKNSIDVKVPDLVQFSGAGDYELKGSTDSHPDNHYLISQSAVNDLISAANDFSTMKWNNRTMRLNDMSLPWGGLFDINHDWSPEHYLHRVGKSVDIENLSMETIDTVDHEGDEVRLTIPNVKWLKKLIKLMSTYGWAFQPEGQLNSDVFKRTHRYPHFEY